MQIQPLPQLHTLPLTILPILSTYHRKKLAQQGILSIKDLLFCCPLRYEDRVTITQLSAITNNSMATIIGTIIAHRQIGSKRTSISCQLRDNSGNLLKLNFFNCSPAQRKRFIIGQQYQVYGQANKGKYGWEMIHPECQLFSTAALSPAKMLTAIYPTIAGIKQATYRKLISYALTFLTTNLCIKEKLPIKIPCCQWRLTDALKFIHQPPLDTDITQLHAYQHIAQQRLIIEELTAHQLRGLYARQQIDTYRAPRLTLNSAIKKKFLAQLAFQLTNAQEQVIKEIEENLVMHRPMLRLVQGDVGAGKTVVAAISALHVIANKQQVAFMAPTELLAQQHATTFTQWFAPLGIEVLVLTGKQTAKIKRQQQTAIAEGRVLMIIGTHALVQNSIAFLRLGLVIIDEQHRFGVHQRLALWQKGENREQYPHQLIMTATPIPRTLAMALYAHLDTSTIDTLPPGRVAIKTVVIADQHRAEVIARIHAVCKQQQRQAYWVCTLIEESEVFDAQAAESTFAILSAALPTLSLGLLHGRMGAAQKKAILDAFRQGAIDLLVTTTVIEVGVDVPNASLMVIENPERLGMAQLHQLRGRIGRGSTASFCILLYKMPLSPNAKQRLQALRETQDGFLLSQHDLALRGPGELLGIRQTGSVKFHVANITRDKHLIVAARKIALELINHQPSYAQTLIARWFPLQLSTTHV